MRCARLIALLLLAGCGHKPLPEIRTITVEKPVPVPCVDTVPERPIMPPTVPADQKGALDLALAMLLAWKAYGIEADGKLRACAG